MGNVVILSYLPSFSTSCSRVQQARILLPDSGKILRPENREKKLPLWFEFGAQPQIIEKTTSSLQHTVKNSILFWHIIYFTL
jgi:hypothetical protein